MNISPTQIETFDERTPYGCERKWWFQYAPNGPKVRTPQSPEQRLGDALHARNELLLKTGRKAEGGTEPVDRMFTNGLPMVEKLLETCGKPVAIEAKVEHLPGISGRIDVLAEGGVIDWKTTGKLENAKTSVQLTTNHQMVIYGLEWLARNPDAKSLRLAHGVYSTREPYDTKLVQVRVAAEHLTKQFEIGTMPIINRIRELENSSSVEDFKANRGFLCQRCPFNSQCPKEMPKMSDALNAFLAKAAKAPSAAPSILPPDAPASQPAQPPPSPAPAKVQVLDLTKATEDQAAKFGGKTEVPSATAPVPAPAEPAPPAKRGPGRPPGSKNKKPAAVMTEVSSSATKNAEVVVDNVPLVAEKQTEGTKLSVEQGRVTKVTVWSEVKIGQPNYSSITFGGSAEATVTEGDDPEDAVLKCRELLSGQLSDGARKVIEMFQKASAK